MQKLFSGMSLFNSDLAPNLEHLKFSEESLHAAVAAVEEARAKTEAILSALGDALSIQDRDFKVLYQNQVHKKLAGDHRGEHCFSAYEGREQICDGCPLALCFQDGGIHSSERAGRTRAVEITASPLKDGSGRIIAGIEIARDITERKHSEQKMQETVTELRRREAETKALLESSRAGAPGLQGDYQRHIPFLQEPDWCHIRLCSTVNPRFHGH